MVDRTEIFIQAKKRAIEKEKLACRHRLEQLKRQKEPKKERPWTMAEVERIMAPGRPRDSVLALEINRTAEAIRQRRAVFKKGRIVRSRSSR